MSRSPLRVRADDPEPQDLRQSVLSPDVSAHLGQLFADGKLHRGGRYLRALIVRHCTTGTGGHLTIVDNLPQLLREDGDTPQMNKYLAEFYFIESEGDAVYADDLTVLFNDGSNTFKAALDHADIGSSPVTRNGTGWPLILPLNHTMTDIVVDFKQWAAAETHIGLAFILFWKYEAEIYSYDQKAN